MKGNPTMTSFVHVDFPLQHSGVVRFERAAHWVQSALQGRALLQALALIGAPVLSIFSALREAREDARFLDAARFDARLMADISRAMDSDARAFGRE